MLYKKTIIPILILSVFFAGLLFAGSDGNKAAAGLSRGAPKAGVVQSQETIDAKMGSSEAVDRISNSIKNQYLSSLQKDDSLIDKRLIKPKTTPASVSSSQAAPANTTVRSGSAVSRGGSRKILTMVTTGYDGCYECNKPFYGKPSYMGLPLQRGIAAVDPQVIPMGTRLYVEGYGEAIAADQGNAIKGNRMDLFFDSHQEALNYGKKTVKVIIY